MDPLTAPRLADGGLATTLQRAGLAPGSSINPWLREHPDRIASVHAAFAAAGSEILVAGTFRTLVGLEPDASELAQRAVEVARSAAPGLPVWASVGPWTAPWSRLGACERSEARGAWEALCSTLAGRVDGFLLETFVDVEGGLAALQIARSAGPVVLSYTVAANGTLHDGTDPAVAVRRALDHGALAAGFNCGTSPENAVRAAERADLDGLWIRPAGDPDDPTALSRALAPIARRCAVVGGCCGAGPDAIAALRESL